MTFASRPQSLSTPLSVVYLNSTQSASAYAAGAFIGFGGYGRPVDQLVYSTGVGSPFNYTFISNYTWLLSGSASDYQVRFTLISGSLSSGTTGVWINPNTGPSWNSVSGSSVSATLEIRSAVTYDVLATSTVSMYTV